MLENDVNMEVNGCRMECIDCDGCLTQAKASFLSSSHHAA
jgi:hypothetical protein